MRTKKTVHRFGERDRKVARFIFIFHRLYNRVPSSTEIGHKFSFTKQSGDYYLKRLRSMGLLRKDKYVSYRIKTFLSEPFLEIKKVLDEPFIK